MRLAGVADRDAADALRGTLFVVDSDDLPPIDDPDEFYDHQLEGLRVRTTAGTDVGTVAEVLHTAAGELLAVRADGDGGEVLVPFVSAIVTSVSLADGMVEIDPPEGLLELELSSCASTSSRSSRTIWIRCGSRCPARRSTSGIVDCAVHDLRRWTHDVHRSVDDAPYGGGPGMVMRAPVWGEALDEICSAETLLVVPTPAGRLFTQAGRRSAGAPSSIWCSPAGATRASTSASSTTRPAGCGSKRCRSATTCCPAASPRRW